MIQKETPEHDRLVFETWRSSGCPTYTNLVKIMQQKYGKARSKSGVAASITRHANIIDWGKPKTKRTA